MFACGLKEHLIIGAVINVQYEQGRILFANGERFSFMLWWKFWRVHDGLAR